MRYLESEVPMARFGRPGEIADFTVFLCSERASFATGLCAVVDGGQTRAV
jgi:NAD(P)-dependent dehydrogenase (short-subunit alcohol dehydrogenase family)